MFSSLASLYGSQYRLRKQKCIAARSVHDMCESGRGGCPRERACVYGGGGCPACVCVCVCVCGGVCVCVCGGVSARMASGM